MNLSNFGAVRLPFLAAAVLALLAAPVSSQVVEKGRTLADLIATHPCDASKADRIARVTDCDAADDIGDGGGAFQCWASCDGSAPWVTQAIGGGGGGAAPDLSAYALLAGDEDGQTIYGVADEGNPSSVGTLLLGVGAAANVVLRAGTTGGSVFAGGTTARLRGPSANDVFEAADGFVKMSSVSGYALITAPAVRVVSAQTPPTNADDTCTTGDTIDTATFHYYCADTDTWVRVAMATWP